MRDPASVFAEEGLEIPEGFSLNVMEAKEQEAVFVLPAKPTAENAIADASER
ncbi:hypothetical protein [Desulfovibrio inopinatus]|uniref:hypothetical protein n=1 Tax=Desulfovibrio inopinatus TaxID=102109 RepID=UPI0012ECB2ED|nr:hypothetical protein [Desulfovibrio inopinatus]